MLNIRPLNEGLRKKAKEELNEVESRIPEDIEALRSWILKQPHLKTRTDDQFLVSFLRGCKYSLEKAKSKIDYFYTIKAMIPEMFSKRTIDEKIIDICRSGAYVRLPCSMGEDGPRIQFTNLSRLDQDKYSFNDLFRYECIMADINIREDDNIIINGFLEVIDLTKLSIGFIAKIDVLLVKKLTIFVEKASPLRLKGIHLVNCPKEGLAVFLLIRSLLSEKIKQRFFIHKDLNELYQHIPMEYLPIEYGGTNGNIPDIQRETEKKLLTYNDYFIDEDNYGVNEKLRPGRKIDSQTLFGIEGSFRKLDID